MCDRQTRKCRVWRNPHPTVPQRGTEWLSKDEGRSGFPSARRRGRDSPEVEDKESTKPSVDPSTQGRTLRSTPSPERGSCSRREKSKSYGWKRVHGPATGKIPARQAEARPGIAFSRHLKLYAPGKTVLRQSNAKLQGSQVNRTI